MGCEIGQQLDIADRTLVTTAPLRSDVPLERADELLERLVRVMGGSLGPHLQLHITPVSLGEARHLAARSGRLLYLTPELRQGKLHLTADFYVQARAFWDRVKAPVSGPLQHAYAERPADGEIRTFFPRPPLVVSQKDSAPLPDRPVLALSCGELGGTLGDQIAFVGRRRVTVGRLRGGALVRHAERDWQELSPVAPAPLRAPLAATRFVTGWLDVGSSDRREAVRLGADLEIVARAPRGLPWPRSGCAPLDSVAAHARLVPCLGTSPEPLPSAALHALGAIDAFAAARVVSPNGTAVRLSIVRPTGHKSAWLADDTGRTVEVPDTGAQIALADLDGDGTVEVITSRPVLDPTKDSLRVESWSADGQLIPRYELPLPDIQALAVCPWPGRGLSPLLVATRDRLQVLR